MEAGTVEAKAFLDLHSAEYQALVNRNTYLINLQFALLPLPLVLLALLVQGWDSKTINHHLLLWSVGIAFQIIASVWLFLMIEQFTTIHYIESTLRPLMMKSLPEPGLFWEYELFLAKRRGRLFAGDCWLTALVLVGLAPLVQACRPFTRLDYVCMSLFMMLIAWLCFQTKLLFGLRAAVYDLFKSRWA